MPTTKIINVFDLGPGDGGKGGVVHKLATHHNAHTIIKAGGAQGSHGVTADDGRKFAFSQWGCGTFENTPTHITNRFVISPEGLLNEAVALQKLGVEDPFSLITCDQHAICTTPYHGFISRLKELALGNNPRGTIGTGVGEAYRDSIQYIGIISPSMLNRKDDIVFSMGRFKDRAIKLWGEVRNSISNEDRSFIEGDVDLLFDEGFFNHCIDRFTECGKQLKIVNKDYLEREVFHKDGIAIIENSHGILTDSECGFKPHVSAIRTMPCYIEAHLKMCGYEGEFKRVGVHRAYTIRHGAGPMPTAGLGTQMELLPGSHKDENRWQGKIRTGPLDFNLLKYAVSILGDIDCLAITWFDQIIKNNKWEYCTGYDSAFDILGLPFFLADRKYIPAISSINVPESIYEAFEVCNKLMSEELKVPVGLVSFGPMSSDKVLNEELVK